MTNKPIMITQTTLKKDRGWTDGLIARFLGQPNRLAPNPHYRSGPKMKLFTVERVEEAEQAPEVAAALAKASARRTVASKSAKAVADAKRQELKAAQQIAYQHAEDVVRSTASSGHQPLQHHQRRSICRPRQRPRFPGSDCRQLRPTLPDRLRPTVAGPSWPHRPRRGLLAAT